MTKQNICNLLLRKHIKSIKPYSTARDEYNGIDASILLNANENPYNILDLTDKNFSDLNRYPDSTQKLLKNAITKDKEVEFENIFLGNGSDEATDILIRMFCEPGKDSLIVMPPTYGMYDIKAKINNVKTIEIPLLENDNDFKIDTKNLFKIIDKQLAKLLFICTPNNPTGGIIEKEIIFEILNTFKGIVVIDEAYIDFSNSQSFSNDLKKYPNLIILQTMSKSWGLADLRIGVCFANKKIINYMNRIKPPCNISGLAQKLAVELITNKATKQKITNQIIDCRIEMTKLLKKCACVEKIFNSEANFIFVKFKNGNTVYNDLAHNGIIVRNKSNLLLCENCLRITIGTKEENKKLLLVLKNID